MLQSYVNWVLAATAACIVMPFLVASCSLFMSATLGLETNVPIALAMAAFAACFFASLWRRRQKFAAWLEPLAVAQSDFIYSIPEKFIWVAIFVAAALSLYLELSVIRWQSSVFEFFSFYKNFGLLACFAGLGVGYVISSRRQVPLVCVVPLLVLQQVALISMRYCPGDIIRSLQALPVLEQLNMGMSDKTSVPEMTALYFSLATVICMTMLAFIPIGQLCGQLMSRISSVRAYGANLLGSLFGIGLTTVSSVFCTPPAVWFTIVFISIAAWCMPNKKSATITLVAAVFGISALSWNVAFGFERVFSPYQLLERGPGEFGWSTIRAAGLYYQRVMDLSPGSRLAHPELDQPGKYYDFPYSYHTPPDSVLIFGAGTGNDVAAALRNGAKHVDAAEIDPCIANWGKLYHPEQPYKDPRVNLQITDARAFLRQSKNQYDMIVFGLLDSHSLSGHASSLRIDSYVYTLESLKEARNHLKPGGVLCLSFASTASDLVRKIEAMMKQSFDGKPPVVIGTNYDESFTYLQNKEANLAPRAVPGSQYKDVSNLLAQLPGNADCSTDDWPFFYMPFRRWPLSYLPMLAVLVGMTYALNRTLARDESGSASGTRTAVAKNAQFFLLGAGFMLIEAKAITELGLAFGNTWQITGTVIAAVLLLGFFGNLLVQYKRIDKPAIAYVLLLIMIVVGWWVSGNGGFMPTLDGQLATIAVVVGPLLFSGIAFSLLISDEPDVSNAMCWNLLGAMTGGIMEYCAMYTGYRALYILALVIYGTAFACNLLKAKAPQPIPNPNEQPL